MILKSPSTPNQCKFGIPTERRKKLGNKLFEENLLLAEFCISLTHIGAEDAWLGQIPRIVICKKGVMY